MAIYRKSTLEGSIFDLALTCFRQRMHQRFAAVRSVSPRASQPAPSEVWNGGRPYPNVIFLWTFQISRAIFFAMAKGVILTADKSEVLQGTLDMMILKTLHALGPLHGFGIARRIEQVSEDVLTLNEGTVYTSLLRLQQQGWIESEWGTSENNRKARFYSITRQGRKQLAVETENWERISGVIGRVLRLEGK